MGNETAPLPNRHRGDRNLLIDKRDVAVGARSHRGRTSRYRLQRRFGRGIEVRRRITTKGWIAKAGGMVLIAVGLIAFMVGFSTDIQIAGGPPAAMMLAGGQAMILGTGLYCYQQLLIRSVQNEENLRFQYDIGYEAGHRDAEKRPVLIDLDAHRCPSCRAARAVAKVGDRG